MTIPVDTDYIVDGLKGIPTAVTLLRRQKTEGLAVSTATLAELFDGVYGQHHPDQRMLEAQRFLDGFIVLDVTEGVAAHFGRIRHILRDGGNLIPDMDLLIAATALNHDLSLLTRNLRHFERVPGLQLFRS